MVQGECACGAVAFEINTAVSGIYYCHCSICRRFTGSNGIAVVGVDNEAFRWARGTEHVTVLEIALGVGRNGLATTMRNRRGRE